MFYYSLAGQPHSRVRLAGETSFILVTRSLTSLDSTTHDPDPIPARQVGFSYFSDGARGEGLESRLEPDHSNGQAPRD